MTAGSFLTYVSSGSNSACAFNGGGSTLMCWGVGSVGQIGNGQVVGEQREPGIVVAPSSPTTGRWWRAVRVGNQFACGWVTVPTGGVSFDVYCWGRNDFGQLGAATTQLCNGLSCSASPVQVAALSGRQITHIAVGATHACAVEAASTVWCWGRNNAGQLGTAGAGGPTPVVAPRPAGMTGTIARIDAGVDATCISSSTGEAYCWGSNARGQLGTNAAENTSSATAQRVAEPGSPSGAGGSVAARPEGIRNGAGR
jgi:alpha-tubulin suppressor-like RCC1 family protein